MKMKIEMEMVPISGGTNMGDKHGDLSDFRLGKYPVTQALWKAVMGNNPSHFQGDNLPVEQVSWDNITQQFLPALRKLTGLDYRLPTESEWEYAAQGGSQSKGYLYAGSNDIDTVAWYSGNSGSKTHAVGGKLPNELGLYDMSGNVLEWCEDTYKPYPTYEGNSYRVRHGGSWNHVALYCRAAVRNYNTPDFRSIILGFRLAL